MGGTGYAVLMACLEKDKRVYVFDQSVNRRFEWSRLTKTFRDYPVTPWIDAEMFAGIGTRDFSETGKMAISEVYLKTAS
jgi:hypothetical protein